MLLSPKMVTSNPSSLLESLHLLSNRQETKMIFKTEMNSSLEIIRIRAPVAITPQQRQTPPNPPNIENVPMYERLSSTEESASSTECMENSNDAENSGNLYEDIVLINSSEMDRSHLPSVPERYQCGICNYKTNKKSNIDKHVKTVHLKEKSSCELCLKSFSNLPQHYRKQHSTTKSKLDKEKLRLMGITRQQSEHETEEQHENELHPGMKTTRQYSHESEESGADISSNLAIDEEILPLRTISQTQVSGKIGNTLSNIPMKRVVSSELQQYEKSPNPANRTIISTTTKQTLKSDAVQFENSVKVDNLQSNGRKLKGTVKPRKRECSDCGKLFANLEQHIKIVHKKIKNFECVNCKRRFYDNRELRNHEFQSLLAGQCRQSNRDGVVGGPRKQHACTYCSYSANRKSNLTLHIESVHLKIKYSCPACQLQVASKPNLSQHMKNCKKYLADHPTEKDPRRILFHCKLCQYSTPRPSHLDRHVLSVHGTEALETVTSVYEASTKSQKTMTAPNSKVPFKIPQFFNLVNLETVEGFSLDHILEDKDFNMDTFSTADLHSEQHFIHTDSQTHHIVQEQPIPTTAHQVQVSTASLVDTHHDNSNSNDNGRLLSTEDIQTVIVTTAEDHMPNDNTIVYGGGNVTNDATQYEVSTLFKLSAQQLQYQNIQVTHENIGPDEYLAPAVSTQAPQQPHQNLAGQQQYTQSHITLQQLPRLTSSNDRQGQIVQHLPDVQVHQLKGGNIDQQTGNFHQVVMPDHNQQLKKVTLNDLDDLDPFNADHYEYGKHHVPRQRLSSTSSTGKIHSSLEDRHLPTAVVHGPVVVHQLHVPAVGKEVVHDYDGDDIDPQHQHSNGSPPQQVLEQESGRPVGVPQPVKPRVSDYMLSGASPPSLNINHVFSA